MRMPPRVEREGSGMILALDRVQRCRDCGSPYISACEPGRCPQEIIGYCIRCVRICVRLKPRVEALTHL